MQYIKSFIIRFLVILFLFCSIHMEVFPQVSSPQEPLLSKIAPTADIIISLVENTGSARIILLLNKNKNKDDIVYKIVDAANQPTANQGIFTISKDEITVNPIKTEDKQLYVADIAVTPKKLVEPGVTYKGNIFFYFKDSELKPLELLVQPITIISNPEPLDCLVSPTEWVENLSPNSLSHLYFEITNTGKKRIYSLEILDTQLKDSTTNNHFYVGYDVKDKTGSKIDLQAGETKSFYWVIPTPARYAGNYTGNVDLLVNGTLKKTLKVTLFSKGPNYFSWFPYLPFTLFVLVTLLGAVISFKLDDWFKPDGGRVYSQIKVSLLEKQSSFQEELVKVADWEKKHSSIKLVNLENILTINLSIVKDILKNLPNLPITDLKTKISKQEEISARVSLLWVVIEKATTEHYGHSSFNKVISELDNANEPTFEAYKDKLIQILRDNPITVKQPGEILNNTPFITNIKKLVDNTDDPKDIRNKMNFYNNLKRIAIIILLLISGYILYYEKTHYFGTSTDYIQVFFLAISVTQVGKDLLAERKLG